MTNMFSVDGVKQNFKNVRAQASWLCQHGIDLRASTFSADFFRTNILLSTHWFYFHGLLLCVSMKNYPASNTKHEGIAGAYFSATKNSGQED